MNKQSLRQPVDGCGGAGESSAVGARVLCNFMSCPPRLSQGLFFLHAREQFFLTLGLHTVSTCDGLLFGDFITTYSARGFVAVFTETGVHGALDRRHHRCASGT